MSRAGAVQVVIRAAADADLPSSLTDYRILMAPEGFLLALVVTALELFLVWRYRAAFAGLVRP